MSTQDFHHETTTTRPAPKSAIGRFLTTMLNRWQRAKTAATLSALDDAILADIGITRSEIPNVAAQVAGLGRGAAPALAGRGSSRFGAGSGVDRARGREDAKLAA